MKREDLDVFADLIIDVHKKENFKYKITSAEKNVLKKISAKHFFEIQKELPFEFTKQFFHPTMNGFVSINIGYIVDYLKQYDDKELDKLINSYCYYKDWSDKLVIAESFVLGRPHRLLNNVTLTEAMKLSYDSDLYRYYKEFGEEDKFILWAQHWARKLIEQQSDSIKYIDEELIKDFSRIILFELDGQRGFNFLLGLSKTVKEKCYLTQKAVYSASIILGFEFFVRLRDRFTNNDNAFETLKLLGIRKTELVLDDENIKYEPTKIKISRDIIEKIKSQPELKDMAQEIENLYSSTLPKHQGQQLKAKL